MCIEYNECHYGGMYNINVKKKKNFCYYINCAYVMSYPCLLLLYLHGLKTRAKLYA